MAADIINTPPHYTQGKIECVHVIEDQKLPAHAAMVLKYLWRYRWKGKPVEDLKKARWWLDRLIRFEELSEGLLPEKK